MITFIENVNELHFPSFFLYHYVEVLEVSGLGLSTIERWKNSSDKSNIELGKENWMKMSYIFHSNEFRISNDWKFKDGKENRCRHWTSVGSVIGMFHIVNLTIKYSWPEC